LWYIPHLLHLHRKGRAALQRRVRAERAQHESIRVRYLRRPGRATAHTHQHALRQHAQRSRRSTPATRCYDAPSCSNGSISEHAHSTHAWSRREAHRWIPPGMWAGSVSPMCVQGGNHHSHLGGRNGRIEAAGGQQRHGNRGAQHGALARHVRPCRTAASSQQAHNFDREACFWPGAAKLL